LVAGADWLGRPKVSQHPVMKAIAGASRLPATRSHLKRAGIGFAADGRARRGSKNDTVQSGTGRVFINQQSSTVLALLNESVGCRRHGIANISLSQKSMLKPFAVELHVASPSHLMIRDCLVVDCTGRVWNASVAC